ncbi:Rid family hydrolase, partial [Enterococcus faecalis]|uniref:Rid family hydrolase n=1 Tax=Enterococcus faecalis TaxID=1351 RepID=UPI003ED9AA16
HPLAAQTVAFSHYNHLSAQLPIEPTSGHLVEGGIRAQATHGVKNIQAVVESINHVMSDIVRMTIFVKDMRDVAAVEEVDAAFFTHYYPAKTGVAV